MNNQEGLASGSTVPQSECCLWVNRLLKAATTPTPKEALPDSEAVLFALQRPKNFEGKLPGKGSCRKPGWPGCLVEGKKESMSSYMSGKKHDLYVMQLLEARCCNRLLELFGVKVFERLRGPDLLAALANPLGKPFKGNDDFAKSKDHGGWCDKTRRVWWFI